MKNFFRIIGIISLAFFGFFFTEKTTSVINENDEIMIKIDDVIDKYKQDSINANIENNDIIPGIKGKKVNRNKSYKEMKKLGYFSDTLLIYDYVAPDISIENNYDKYIVSGNKNKNMVSLIFLVDNNDSIDNILTILESNDVKANFFVDEVWLENNNDLLTLIKNKGHDIGNLSNNLDYTSSSFIWMDVIIKKVVGQKFGYCYAPKENDSTIKNCSLNKDYTIKPNIIIENNYLIEVKKQITPGAIIVFNTNKYIEKELNLIINYINSKGYKIENLSTHLSE